MGVKKELEAARKSVQGALNEVVATNRLLQNKELGAVQVDLSNGIKSIASALKVYEEKKKKSKDGLAKLDSALDKVKGVLESHPIDDKKGLAFIAQATAAATIAEKAAQD